MSADRETLANDFAATLAADFAQHGKAAITTLRETKLDAYLRLVAAIEPKAEPKPELPLEGLSDEDLSAMLATVRAAMAEK